MNMMSNMGNMGNMNPNMNIGNVNMMANSVNIGGINPNLNPNVNQIKQFVILIDGTSSLRNSFSKLRKEIIDPLLLSFHEKHCTFHPTPPGNVPATPTTIEYSIIIYRSSSYHSENDSICFDGGGYRYTHNLAGGLQTAFDLIYSTPVKAENYLLLITNSEPSLVINPAFGNREKSAKDMLKTLVEFKCFCSFICPRELDSLSQMWVECTGVQPSKPVPSFSGYVTLHSLEYPVVSAPAPTHPSVPPPSQPVFPNPNMPKKPVQTHGPIVTGIPTTIQWAEEGKTMSVAVELVPLHARPSIQIPQFVSVNKFIGLNEVTKKPEWAQSLKFKIVPSNPAVQTDFPKLTVRLSSRNFGVILLDLEWALLIFVSQTNLMGLLVKKSSIVTPNGTNPLP